MAKDTTLASSQQMLSNFGDPENQDVLRSKLDLFVGSKDAKDKRFVIITSGGTSVPLEKNAVRSIENFSTGRRGAISAEYFLRTGYRVIYLHREGCFMPFTRILKSQIEKGEIEDIFTFSNGTLGLSKTVPNTFTEACFEHQKFRCNILLIPFTTLSQYMHSFHTVCSCLKGLGRNVMLYLAAAVSDFHIPPNDMPTHKIQSCSKQLVLNLEPVPKMLPYVVQSWIPESYVVSFKLETDPEILERKASNALKKYKHQAVVANLLQSRYTNVKIFTEAEKFSIDLAEKEFKSGVEIEQRIVGNLIALHKLFIEKQGG